MVRGSDPNDCPESWAYDAWLERNRWVLYESWIESLWEMPPAWLITLAESKLKDGERLDEAGFARFMVEFEKDAEVSERFEEYIAREWEKEWEDRPR